MNYSPRVVAALSTLTQILDDPTIDIAQTLDQLAHVVRLAVPSSVGLSVRSGPDHARIELTGGRDDTTIVDIGASMMMALPNSTAGTRPTSTTIVFYATSKGAFVDLAADVTWLAGTRVADVVLDQHLVPPSGVDPQVTLEALAAVDQAIGMLLGRGYTPEQAEDHILERAALTHVSAHSAAELIMSQLIAAGPVELDPDVP